ncbi:MAG: hypothetical protein LIV24_08905 [Eubacterium sp.]|nr:hypothetical protein [Eubacterium sp.]
MTDYQALKKQHRPIHNGDPFSLRHPKMARGNRAKLFAPFDALAGFDESMDAETVLTVHPAELSEDMKKELDEKLALLVRRFEKLPKKRLDRKGLLQISVLYFEEDAQQTLLKNDGVRGNYRWISGDLLDIDSVRKTICLNGRNLDISRIYAIETGQQSRVTL